MILEGVKQMRLLNKTRYAELQFQTLHSDIQLTGMIIKQLFLYIHQSWTTMKTNSLYGFPNVCSEKRYAIGSQSWNMRRQRLYQLTLGLHRT